MTDLVFDADAHRRGLNRQLRERVEYLENERDRLQRLLYIACQAAAGNECQPLALLAVIEDLDRVASKPPDTISHDRMVELLGGTPQPHANAA